MKVINTLYLTFVDGATLNPAVADRSKSGKPQLSVLIGKHPLTNLSVLCKGCQSVFSPGLFFVLNIILRLPPISVAYLWDYLITLSRSFRWSGSSTAGCNNNMSGSVAETKTQCQVRLLPCGTDRRTTKCQ